MASGKLLVDATSNHNTFREYLYDNRDQQCQLFRKIVYIKFYTLQASLIIKAYFLTDKSTNCA